MKREGALGKELPLVYKRCPPELSQKRGGWCTVVLCDPSFKIPGTAAAISDVFGNFGMCHLVGE